MQRKIAVENDQPVRAKSSKTNNIHNYYTQQNQHYSHACNVCGEIFANASRLNQHRAYQIYRTTLQLHPSIRNLCTKECADCTNKAKSGGKICTSCSLELVENQIISDSNQNVSPTREGISETISSYCSLLRLTKEVQIFACELFNRLVAKKEMKWDIDSRSIVVVAACVYIGIKEYRYALSCKELCDGFGVNRSAVHKLYNKIHKLKSGEMLILPVVHKRKGIMMESVAERFAQKYANQLKLNGTTIKNLKKVARNIMRKELFAGKSPTTIGAIMVYLTCFVSEDTSQRRSYKEISAVSKVSDLGVKRILRKYFYYDTIVVCV